MTAIHMTTAMMTMMAMATTAKCFDLTRCIECQNVSQRVGVFLFLLHFRLDAIKFYAMNIFFVNMILS